MSEKNELTIVEPIDKEEIKNQIYELRGYKIMLDRDITKQGTPYLYRL